MSYLLHISLFIFSTIFGIMGFLIRSKISEMENDIKNLEQQNKEIEENYLDRFDKLNKNINQSKIEILDRFHQFEIKIIEKLK